MGQLNLSGVEEMKTLLRKTDHKFEYCIGNKHI